MQAIISNHLLDRVTAMMRLLSGSAEPPGVLLGGILGEYCGLRITAVTTGAGTLLAFPVAAASPVRQTHRAPVPIDSC